MCIEVGKRKFCNIYVVCVFVHIYHINPSVLDQPNSPELYCKHTRIRTLSSSVCIRIEAQHLVSTDWTCFSSSIQLMQMIMNTSNVSRLHTALVYKYMYIGWFSVSGRHNVVWDFLQQTEFITQNFSEN